MPENPRMIALLFVDILNETLHVFQLKLDLLAPRTVRQILIQPDQLHPVRDQTDNSVFVVLLKFARNNILRPLSPLVTLFEIVLFHHKNLLVLSYSFAALLPNVVSIS